MSNPLKPYASLPPQTVAPLPDGMLTTRRAIAHALGLVDERALLDECSQPGAPSLPYLHRIGGEMHCDRDAALTFVERMRVFLLREPERRAAEEARAKARSEQAMAERAARNALEQQQAADRYAFFRDAEKAQVERTAKVTQTGNAVITDGTGRIFK